MLAQNRLTVHLSVLDTASWAFGYRGAAEEADAAHSASSSLHWVWTWGQQHEARADRMLVTSYLSSPRSFPQHRSTASPQRARACPRHREIQLGGRAVEKGWM